VAVLELSEESLDAVLHLVSHLRELEGLPPVEESQSFDLGSKVVVSMPAVESASALAMEPA
jgi:hypothetical protein